MAKTDFRSLYDKEFIGSWDLDGTDKTITITKVVGGTLTGVGGRKSRKPVIYFDGSEKGFALNATNGKTIAAMYGKYIEGWPGKKITLYKAMTRDPSGEAEEVECIRVRNKVPDKGFGAEDAKLTTAQAQEIEQLCAAKGVPLADVWKQAGGITATADMLASDFAGCKNWIDKRAAKMAKDLADTTTAT